MEVVVAYFEVLSRSLHGETEEDDEKLNQDIRCSGRD
jgi:hypothetical protein